MDITQYLVGVPQFLIYFGMAFALLLAFALMFVWLTPHREWNLIRENNVSAAIAFGGSLLGFSIALHSAISHSINWMDFLSWGGIAFLAQGLAYFALRFAMPDLSARIARNEIASGILSAFFAISIGLLNAASMSYQQ